MNKVCVMIPVHTANPGANEILAFRQCFHKLSQFDIFIVAPEELNLDIYKNAIAPRDPVVKYVDPSWMRSLSAYNKMKISLPFYLLFAAYEYMLTYELDAYVFGTELTNWCRETYDYIGAPFFEGFDKTEADSKPIGIGNSGFSLRNVQSCIRILESSSRFIRTAEFFSLLKMAPVLRAFVILEKLIPGFTLKKIRIVRAFLKNEYTHEDTFWSIFVPRVYPFFKIATLSDGLAFAFDANPAGCYKLNGNRLPFGCHAWAKYDPQFWAKFISNEQQPVNG